jgi:hypothetical protein
MIKCAQKRWSLALSHMIVIIPPGRGKRCQCQCGSIGTYSPPMKKSCLNRPLSHEYCTEPALLYVPQ